MLKFFYSIIFGLCVFAVVRAISYLLDLDERAKKFVAFITQLPPDKLQAAALLISGLIGLAALLVMLIINPWSKIAEFVFPRPEIGSLALSPDPVFHLNIDRATNTAKAELHADLTNQNDKLIQYDAELRATVNGKDLDAPIRTSGYVAARGSTRLFVRVDNVPVISEPYANFRYEVTYFFKRDSRSRRTVRGIHWETVMPPTPRGRAPAPHVVHITTTYYDQFEE